MAAFMTPCSRMMRVSSRVSTPQSPGTFCSFKKVSRSQSARKLEGLSHHSRTTYPFTQHAPSKSWRMTP